MASLQRQHDTLKIIVQKSPIRFICPQCLRGFPRSDALYRHFREQQDDIHKGLYMRDTDHKSFLSCYQEALGASISAVQLPIGPKCFDVSYIVEHYGEDAEKHQHMIPKTTAHSGETAESSIQLADVSTSAFIKMQDIERQLNTLNRIIQQTSIKFVCPKCLKGFPRPDILYDHFRKENDDIHKALDMRKTHFKQFLDGYQSSLRASIPAEKLPPASKCFEIQYVLEHYDEDSGKTTQIRSGNYLHPAQGYLYLPTESASPNVSAIDLQNYSAPVHSDRQPRGYYYRNDAVGETFPPNKLARVEWIWSLEWVEDKIRALIPQMENWLNGTLPLPEIRPDRPGVIMPTVDIDIPLVPIRDLLYKGFGLFTLLRTYKETSTPVNFSKAVYTALRIDGSGVIGHTPVTLGKSVWVDAP
ncbi:hypothetical protein BBP40_003093 [Aspergillus hancockii]|nr:hypothetical protein BBP40_003093 [Aspergillus hancockii]